MTAGVGRAALAAMLVAGCAPHSYHTRGTPRCVSRAGDALATLADGYCMMVSSPGTIAAAELAQVRCLQTFPTGRTASFDTFYVGESVVFALLHCPALSPEDYLAREREMSARAAELTADHVPEVCAGQRILVHRVLRPTLGDQAERRGLAGVYDLPEMPVPCQGGYRSQAPGETLAQLKDGYLAAQLAHLAEHGSWAGLGRLQQLYRVPALPDDPWGRPFYVTVMGASRSEMRSAGPDVRRSSEDDQVLLALEATITAEGWHAHVGESNGFVELGHTPGSHYGRFVKARLGDSRLTWVRSTDHPDPELGEALPQDGSRIEIPPPWAEAAGLDAVSLSWARARADDPPGGATKAFRLSAASSRGETLDVLLLQARYADPQCSVRVVEPSLTRDGEALELVLQPEACAHGAVRFRISLPGLFARFHGERASAAARRGDEAAARQALERAILLDPFFAEATYELAVVLARRGEAGAVERLADAVTLAGERYAERAAGEPAFDTLRQDPRYRFWVARY